MNNKEIARAKWCEREMKKELADTQLQEVLNTEVQLDLSSTDDEKMQNLRKFLIKQIIEANSQSDFFEDEDNVEDALEDFMDDVKDYFWRRLNKENGANAFNMYEIRHIYAEDFDGIFYSIENLMRDKVYEYLKNDCKKEAQECKDILKREDALMNQKKREDSIRMFFEELNK